MGEQQTADVIVVGLGAFGSATAYQLAKRGVRVIGIDQFSPPHDRGSSHGATRITRLAVGEGEVYVPIVKRSQRIVQELEEASGEKLFYRTGGLIMGVSDGTASHHGKPDFVRRTIDNAVRFDIPHEVLSGGEIARRYPQFITQGDETAYFEPDSGVLIPEACVRVQLDQARALGASLRVNERVLDIQESGNGVDVRTTAGSYSAAKVIVAGGPWVPSMSGGVVGKNLRVLRQTLHWFAVDEPTLYAPEACPVFIWMHGSGDEDYMYGFPMIDGKAGVKVASEQYRIETSPDDYARVVSPQESAAMFDAHVHGRLRSIRREAVHSAACLYTVSTDSGFVVDAFRNMRNAKVVSACSGHGFKHSAGFGEMLALDAMGIAPDDHTPDIADFSVSRFI